MEIILEVRSNKNITEGCLLELGEFARGERNAFIAQSRRQQKPELMTQRAALISAIARQIVCKRIGEEMPTSLVLARYENELVGYSVSSLPAQNEQPPTKPELFALGVKLPYMRRGIGTMLMKKTYDTFSSLRIDGYVTRAEDDLVSILKHLRMHYTVLEFPSEVSRGYLLSVDVQ